MKRRSSGGGERVLALETASAELSLAIGENSKILSVFHSREHWRHAEALFGGLDALLKKTKTDYRDLAAIVVDVGPGSFTGIRIGLAAARTLGQFLNIPLIAVSALEVMAYEAATRAGRLAVTMDALRGDVFGGVYEKTPSGEWKTVVKDRLYTDADWKATVQDLKRAGALRWLKTTTAKGPFPRAETALRLSRLKTPQPYADVLPSYLREAAPVERQRLSHGR